MELTKHKNHRNPEYLNWLRSKNCLVSKNKAECAHHVRLGTNGGTGLKPSDYFCIPLLHEYHTTGKNALHKIGEKTFLDQFQISPLKVFTRLLIEYLFEYYKIVIFIETKDELTRLWVLIDLVEDQRPKNRKKTSTKKNKKKTDESFKIKKREYEREIRKKIKLKQKGNPEKESLKEKQKLEARIYAKKIRDQNKEKMSKYRKEQYQKLKKLKKERNLNH